MTRLLTVSASALMLAILMQAQGSSVADRAVVAALVRVSSLPHAVVMRRLAADPQWDLVVAMASQAGNDTPQWWSTKDRLGVLVQDRNEPSKVYVLATQPGPNDDCAFGIVRMTAEELVISCTGEKSQIYDSQNFVYDIRARKLVSHFSYPPFRTSQIVQGKNGPQFVMADNHRLLLVQIDPAGIPRVVPAAAARATLAEIPMDEFQIGTESLRGPKPPQDPVLAFGAGERFKLAREKNKYGSEFVVIAGRKDLAGKLWVLPQTDFKTWEKARPDDVKSYLHPDTAEFNEQIGPHQLEGDRLWFGKTFYNSEGLTGVGGFGYFDTTTARYILFSPPEIHKWSVSAILVEADNVWLALFRRGEYGDTAGGLLRWDRKSARAEWLPVKSIATSMARQGDAIFLGATDGIVAVRGASISSYFVERKADGSYQMAAR